MIHRAFFTAALLQVLLLAIPLTALPEQPLPLPAEEPTLQQEPTQSQTEAPTEPPTEPPTQAPSQSSEPAPQEVRVLMPEGQVETMALEDYLWGVVAAEMPASFQPEALKAQAVAARSYTCWQAEHPTGAHPDAQVCCDFACCQAWISREQRLEQWPEEHREEYSRKITEAIQSTAEERLLWQGETALAVFHASSAGQTRSAEEVWGRAIPYLVSVDSPEGEADAPNYYSVVRFTPEEFREKTEAGCPGAQLGEDVTTWIQQAEDGTLRVGGVTLSNLEVRKLYALRSASFTVECSPKGITFYVTGYGHGVGMSQYGANVMAREGADYRAILAHYYPGTEIG